ncbi:YkgJ family cysteine cluster protein [Paludisphaera mucosa]|uniref:YkgJ family cysteine cluster protein n=1 Tax=Paludisphaera mucosa TaxID=3030827 RepID=A0ABT6FGT8_9BACT|nr:YkgJ family cysteine cluster protein [Paludisphaera mucosa]MDG3006798.1 YkgJ family cysteine cluster protein [Paludisphaera mucosa]
MATDRTARIELRLPAGSLELEVTAPDGDVPIGRVLPLARALSDRIVELTVLDAEAHGRAVSCRAGCGACCRQLVPIGQAEARRIAELVDAMPEPRRNEVRRRFDAAARKLDEAGLAADLRRRDAWDADDRRRVGLTYFHQGVPCPFLEDESCSIHPDRPLACREYLVTSPAENCSHPTAEGIDMVRMPTSVWTAAARLEPPVPGARSISWTPLVLALEFAAGHPEEPPTRPARVLVDELFRNVAGPLAKAEADPSA